MRRRIVTLAVTAAMLAIFLFGLPLGFGVVKFYRASEYSELERAADSVMVAVAPDLVEGIPPTRLPQLDPEESEALVGVYTPDGTLLIGEGPKKADHVVMKARGSDWASGDVGDQLVVAVPVVNGDELSGMVRAAIPRSQLYRHVAVTWLGMLGLAVVAIATTWLVARRLAARLARPLEELSAAAERLGEGDFTVRARRAGLPETDRVAETLDTTAERIRETLEREQAFAANASHQLRTPLTGLRLQLEAALESPDMEPRHAIAAGISSADRLERTIDDLIALSRLTRKPNTPLDLHALLAELRPGWEELLDGRGLRIVTSDTWPPRASAAAVRQVLGVLLDNAVIHGSGTVTVLVREAGDAIAVDVSDEGAGIDGDVDLFAVAHTTAEGHGIGLALARSLAEAEGGRLRLTRPTPPTFTLLLPGEDPADGD
ncbi:sensor histidine kinase [Amycolatopsis sp. cg5]|uniref:sensor histidine kinase n=1 Tax=Amycolatopsis sp. cg5 TaxID=3238802 RepID=UPI0035254662